MSYTERDLARILANPDITLVTDGACTTIQPVARQQVGKQSERDLQQSLFDHIERNAVADSRYLMCAALPNGQYRPGQRMEPGLKSGLPDIGIFLPRPANGKEQKYCGAFIELKREDGRISLAQGKWIKALRQAGYFVSVCWSLDDAIQTVDWYLSGARYVSNAFSE